MRVRGAHDRGEWGARHGEELTVFEESICRVYLESLFEESICRVYLKSVLGESIWRV